MSVMQAPASEQYRDSLKWPQYRKPTHEEWNAEVTALRTELAAIKAAQPSEYKRADEGIYGSEYEGQPSAISDERPGWVSEWQPIETAAKLRKVLVAYKNGAGNWRRVIACYYPPETLESEYEESGWSEEGWYEESETHEEIRRTDCEPTHWMPLPAAPKEAR